MDNSTSDTASFCIDNSQPSPPSQRLMGEVEWKEAILAQYDPAPDLAAMTTAAERIFTMALRRSEIVRSVLPHIQQEMDSAEGLTLLDINSAADEKGKPTYSNAEARKAALQRALDIDAGYHELLTERTKHQRELDQLDAESELAHRRYTVARYSVEYKTASVRVLGL